MEKYSKENFIKKAREVHGDKYDYSKVEYVNAMTKVCIICPVHGEFWQIPASHLRGIGCRFCGNEKRANKKRRNTSKFIEEAKKIHGNKYDYSKVEYVDAHTKVCIICPIHGEFWQKPMVHLNQKCGCPKCGNETTKNKTALTKEEFIEKARKVHGDKYDYSKVEYINSKTKICIICPTHGEFWQTPENHLQGQGCIECYKQIPKKRITTDEWIERAKTVHGNRYDYSKTIYNGYYNKVTIICKIHGEFQQTAYDHLQGKGCPKCSKSKLEIEMSDFLDRNNIMYEEQVRPNFLSNGKSHLSLDFYLPDYNAAIECQGKQHFIDGTFYSKKTNEIKERDEKKYKLCANNDIKIYYYSNFKIDEYIDKVYSTKEELLKIIISENEKRFL